MQNVKEAKGQRDETYYASKHWVFAAEPSELSSLTRSTPRLQKKITTLSPYCSILYLNQLAA
jgi:hypothetical protein